MDAEAVNLVSGWAGIAGGVALALVGVVALARQRPRVWGSVAFSVFLLGWGLQEIAANAARIATSAAWAEVGALLNLALLLPLPYFLLAFAEAHSGVPRRATWVAAALAAVAIALLALEPSLLVRGIAPQRHTFRPLWGPAYVPLVVVPFFAAQLVALLAIARAHARAPTANLRRRHAVVLAGMGLLTGFAGGNNLAYYVLAALRGQRDASPWLLALFAATSAAVAAIGLRLARSGRRDVALAFGVALGYGALEGVLNENGWPLLSTIGLWRAAGAALLAYGLLRWTEPGIDARARRVSAFATGAAGGLASGVLSFGLASLVVPPAWAIVPAAGVSLGLAIPGVRFARRAFRAKPPALVSEDALFGQRIETYRAALEASVARGSLAADAEFLDRLRERLSIGEEAHRVLLHYARSAILVPTQEDPRLGYEKLRLLGEGGAGRTWLARERSRDRLVVLKEPVAAWHDGPVREAALREARLALRVRHPRVVRVEDVVQDGDAALIVMEYVEGGSLADALRRRGSLPWREAVALGIGILDGLEAIHAAGVVHRDIKPSNVLLTREGEPKIADFGIALAPGSGATRRLTGPPTLAGTLAYMAPEVHAGRSVGDARSDIYAAGALLHECLHGAPPGVPPRPSAEPAPNAVLAALDAALAADPAARPRSARELRRRLEEALP